jgi:BirA family biotin operon repressor/biotin-[acetyl-CoA-carboxylase] ligase
VNIIGSNIIRLIETSSTNEYAVSLLSNIKHIEGAIVVSDFQKKGKGQGKNIWISEKGANILISILVAPKFLEIDKQFFLSIAVSLAILRTLKKYTKSKCKIKWPNDLYVNDKKICGILIQNSLGGKEIKNSIIGIGLNVNQTSFVGLGNATSLKLESGNEFDKEIILKTLIEDLNYYYNILKLEKYNLLKQEYENNLYKKNILTNYKLASGKLIQGFIRGIKPSGQLILVSENQELCFNNKEIIFL